jgi:hypothetical protein
MFAGMCMRERVCVSVSCKSMYHRDENMGFLILESR